MSVNYDIKVGHADPLLTTREHEEALGAQPRGISEGTPDDLNNESKKISCSCMAALSSFMLLILLKHFLTNQCFPSVLAARRLAANLQRGLQPNARTLLFMAPSR